MLHTYIERYIGTDKIPLKISGMVIGILPIPMYHFMYETSGFLCDFMELIPQKTQYFPVNVSS